MTTPPEKNSRTGDSRERILHAAVTLFARQGFDRTGLRELAGVAGVNLAMINYFFGSKKKLLTEILDIFFSQYLDIAGTELTGKGGLYVRLERFITRTTAFFDTHKDFLLVAIAELHHNDPEIIEHKAAWGRQMIEIMEQEVCQPLAKETGLEISPKLIAPLLTSMMSSRFLFSPVMDKIETDNTGTPGPEKSYSETIAGIFLWGIAGKKNTALDASGRAI
jgi:AcrR family transcriptional regulator